MIIQPPTSNHSESSLPELSALVKMATQLFRELPISPAAISSPTLTSASVPTTLPGTPTLQPLPQSLPHQGLAHSHESVTSAHKNDDALDRLADHALANRLDSHSFYLPGQQALEKLVKELVSTSVSHPLSAGDTSLSVHPQILGYAAKNISGAGFDIHAVRRDFSILAERINGKLLAWLDNVATTQKPQAVIDRLSYFYEHENSNIHRAAHTLAARSTDAYESARQKIAHFIGAGSSDEIVFVRGATEGINLIAQAFGQAFIRQGDEIIVSHLEHHANIVPWQQVAAVKAASLKVIPVDDHGQILLDEFKKLINSKTRIVAISQVSNALGTVVPVGEVIQIAHAAGVRVLVDGAQAVSHMPINVQAMDADFYVFSGHKVFGPTGIGAVYGKLDLLNQLPPWQGGGNMIVDVTFERTIYHNAPAPFEAGTGNIADAVGLGAAIDYLQHLGMSSIASYEHSLLEYGTHQLHSVPGLKLIGTAADKAGVLSFVIDGLAPEDIGKALNEEGIAVRSGHHCAQPILRRFGLEATVRPSLAFYNTCDEIDRLVDVLRHLSRRRY